MVGHKLRHPHHTFINKALRCKPILEWKKRHGGREENGDSPASRLDLDPVGGFKKYGHEDGVSPGFEFIEPFTNDRDSWLTYNDEATGRQGELRCSSPATSTSTIISLSFSCSRIPLILLSSYPSRSLFLMSLSFSCVLISLLFSCSHILSTLLLSNIFIVSSKEGLQKVHLRRNLIRMYLKIEKHWWKCIALALCELN